MTPNASPFPARHAQLRLDPPFYLESALIAAGINFRAIDTVAFSDDRIATALNDVLRASIEAAGVDHVPRHG